MPTNLEKMSYKGGPKKIRTYPEAATQTFKRGDPVILSSGKVAIANSSSNLYTSTDLLGFAERDATGTTDTDIPVMLPGNGTEFVACLANGAAEAVWAATYTGTAYDMRLNSSITSGALGFCVDVGSTSTANAEITGVIPGTENDTTSKVVFTVPTGKRILGA